MWANFIFLKKTAINKKMFIGQKFAQSCHPDPLCHSKKTVFQKANFLSSKREDKKRKRAREKKSKFNFLVSWFGPLLLFLLFVPRISLL
jgi:hypothetical protein